MLIALMQIGMRIRIMIFYLMWIWFQIQLINFDTDPDFYLMRCGADPEENPGY
jgi:hypothetical protein